MWLFLGWAGPVYGPPSNCYLKWANVKDMWTIIFVIPIYHFNEIG